MKVFIVGVEQETLILRDTFPEHRSICALAIVILFDFLQLNISKIEIGSILASRNQIFANLVTFKM
jgi:hypothetical protein